MLDIQTSDTVLDLGEGKGYFTLPTSKLCRKVIALDVATQMLEYLQEKIFEQGITNVELVRGEMEQIPLEADTADHVIASFVIHEVDPLESGLKEIHRVLKPEGKVLCVEWEKRHGARPAASPSIAFRRFVQVFPGARLFR